MINRKITFIVAALAFVTAAFASYAYFAGGGNGPSMPSIGNYKVPIGNNGGTTAVDTSEPKTEECPLNGEMLGKSSREKWETRRPLGIMVENSVDARDQSGVSTADVVYEAVAEGGITRFLLMYYCKDAPFVGPVRSARVHFMKMLREYGEYPLYAHVGGANCDEETGSGCANGAKADALGIISKLGWAGYNDMNQFSVPFPVFYRDPDRLPNRATEHTVYSSTAKLWDYAKTKRGLTNVDKDGVAWDKEFIKWKFKDNAAENERGTTNKISFGFWDQFSSDFSVNWNYNKATNSYKRVNGGKPHLDKNTGKQLEAKNIVVILADESPANDGYPGGHLLYALEGEGDAYIFQDGKAIKGTWNKKDPESRTQFLDENGKELSFVRGQIFVEILPTGNKVTY